MKTLKEIKNELLKEQETAQPEMDLIRAIVDARTSQNITLRDLAERTGINQSVIFNVESGLKKPSLYLLKKLASGMKMSLEIRFVPQKNVL